MHPMPIIPTEEGLAQRIYPHAYDEESSVREKVADGGDQASADVKVVFVQQEEEDLIRESGMSLLIKRPLEKLWISHARVCFQYNIELLSTVQGWPLPNSQR
jgi:hypothetical protein